MIGKILRNRYKILEPLGGGGMSVVYMGHDILLKRNVTIKVLRSEFALDEGFLSRFRREAQAVARLSHPNIVNIYDFGKEEEIYYLVMEYIDGDSLKNLIKKQGGIPVAQAVRFAGQVCDALKHAHEKGIVHRDIKPHNILIDRSGKTKLTDFGIARDATSATLTRTNTIIGSVHYLSPEQIRGEKVDSRSDLYSLGVVLYEMIIGAVPFQGDTPISIALKHIQEDPLRHFLLSPMPPAVERVIIRALAKTPEKRYQTAGEMGEDLEDTLRSRQVEDTTGDTTRSRRVEDTTGVIQGVEPETGEAPVKVVERPWYKRFHKRLWAAAGLAAIVVLSIAFALPEFYPGIPKVTVPGVEGRTEAEARSILNSNGLEQILVSYTSHPVVGKERVISQEPPEGSKVKANRPVKLVLGLESELYAVPGVISLAEADARLMIKENGFVVSEPVRREYNNEYGAGTVAAQEPGPGSRAVKGSPVTIILSKGPQAVAGDESVLIYKNDRFGFSIKYPVDFIGEPAPANDDGRVFRAPDGSAKLLVYGAYNSSGQDARTMYDQTLRGIDGDIGYKIAGDGWYVISWVKDNIIYYHKTILKNNSVDTFIFSYPEEQRTKYDQVVGDIEKSFIPDR